MKAINYKMKKLNSFVHSSKRSPWDLQLSRMSYAYKKNVKYDKKSKNSFTFFVKNPCGSQ